MHDKFVRFKLLSLGFCVILLASCATAPPPKVERSAEDIVAEADAALAADEQQQAARLLELAAERSESPAREHLVLRAASLHLHLDDLEKAGELLKELPKALPRALHFHRELLEIRRLMQLERPASAFVALMGLQAPPPHLHAEWLRLRAEVNEAVGMLVEAVEARSELDEKLEGEAAEANRELLWRTLSQVPMELLGEYMPPPTNAFGGWLELAYVVRSHRLDSDRLGEALSRWQRRYPDHPAAAELVGELLMRYRDQLRRPERLALLLPLSGPLSTPAQAVRDGFLAALYQDKGELPILRVYDIGADGNHVVAAYQEAITEGADMVVGPLTSDSLLRLAGLGELPVPTLALNTLRGGTQAPENLFQFGLSPEDEARAAARYATERGWESGVVLVPEGAWGQRVAQAFSEAFDGEYQHVLEVAYYNAEGTDYGQPIRSILNLDASDRRARQLRNALGHGVRSEPHRRQDVDFIFIGAFPREARLIRPQLRFHHAMNLPVLATSHIYDGNADPRADSDMDGVRFVEIPWLLHPQGDDGLSREDLQALWPGVERNPRLYALGIDAYRILPYLQALREHSGDTIDGKTGILRVDQEGLVHRTLLPARFHRGQPRADHRAPEPRGLIEREDYDEGGR